MIYRRGEAGAERQALCVRMAGMAVHASLCDLQRYHHACAPHLGVMSQHATAFALPWRVPICSKSSKLSFMFDFALIMLAGTDPAFLIFLFPVCPVALFCELFWNTHCEWSGGEIPNSCLSLHPTPPISCNIRLKWTELDRCPNKGCVLSPTISF